METQEPKMPEDLTFAQKIEAQNPELFLDALKAVQSDRYIVEVPADADEDCIEDRGFDVLVTNDGKSQVEEGTIFPGTAGGRWNIVIGARLLMPEGGTTDADDITEDAKTSKGGGYHTGDHAGLHASDCGAMDKAYVAISETAANRPEEVRDATIALMGGVEEKVGIKFDEDIANKVFSNMSYMAEERQSYFTSGQSKLKAALDAKSKVVHVIGDHNPVALVVEDDLTKAFDTRRFNQDFSFEAEDGTSKSFGAFDLNLAKIKQRAQEYHEKHPELSVEDLYHSQVMFAVSVYLTLVPDASLEIHFAK